MMDNSHPKSILPQQSEEKDDKRIIKNNNADISHQELVKLTKEAIRNIIESDPLLRGLPTDVTIEEVKAQTAVAQGQAITIYLNRGELPELGIVVPPLTTTVLDLKKAIKRHTNLALKREKVKKKISWRHVWKKYHLCFGDVRLTDNNQCIKFYGITNKTELHYVKRRREKNKFMKVY